jgi:hypothetical protein
MQEHEGRLRRIHQDIMQDERREGEAAGVPHSADEREGQQDADAGKGDSTGVRVSTARRALFPEAGGSEHGGSTEKDAIAASREQHASDREKELQQLMNDESLTAARDGAQLTQSGWI